MNTLFVGMYVVIDSPGHAHDGRQGKLTQKLNRATRWQVQFADGTNCYIRTPLLRPVIPTQEVQP